MNLLTLQDLTAARHGRKVLNGINLIVEGGEFIGLLGPNGAGKTTLLRAALGLLAHGGHSSLTALPAAERARYAAFMAQGRDISWPLPVADLVALGRMPHGRSPADTLAVERAISALELEPLRHRPATELSGGEQARALIARMLAQETPLLIADEPIAGLDPAAQITVMKTFAGIAGQGRTVLASLHDLGLAARHCTRLILMADGRIAADGPPEQVLHAESLARVFGITAWFATTPQGSVFQPLDILTKEQP